MDDNERIELWAESVIFSEEFFTRLQGDEDNPPDFLGAAMYLKDAFVDTSIQWLKDNPEEAIVAFFGMDEYRKCRIDPSWITTAYDEASKISKAADYGFAVRDLIDSLVVISETTDYETQDYKDAMGDLGRNFLNLTSMLVGEIPLLGDFYSNIVDAISCKYEEALGIINKHVAQLQFTELMCDYYTQNWTADRLVGEFKVKLIKSTLERLT